jgi:hypothetical protein
VAILVVRTKLKSEEYGYRFDGENQLGEFPLQAGKRRFSYRQDGGLPWAAGRTSARAVRWCMSGARRKKGKK